MKTARNNWLAMLLFPIALGCASSANATWTFFGPIVGGDAYLNVTPNVVGDPGLHVSGAYAASGSASIGAGFASGTKWVTDARSMLQYDAAGLGIDTESGDSAPANAFDNVGKTEAMLLDFGSSVVLTSIGIGFVSGDSDISLFRYIGPGSPPPSSSTSPTLGGVGANLSSMIAVGWELVGNYGNLLVDTVADPNYNPVNSTGKGSSWWLITAYNANYGAATSGAVDQGNDYFKVYAVAANKCGIDCGPVKVPEPATITLLAIGLLGVWQARRPRLAPILRGPVQSAPA